MSSEVLKAVESIGESIELTRKQHAQDVAALRERLEVLEAGRDRPRAVVTGTPADHKAFHTANGLVYELPSTTKLQDVLRPEKVPEISAARWLSATVLGEKCNDAEAVRYCREQKQLTTATSGVLVPTEYVDQWIDLLRAQSVLNRAGMTTVTMDAKVQTHSAVTGDPTVGWHSEGGAINSANPTFSARTLTARTLVARCQASLELAQDSPNFGQQLSNVILGAFAAEVDRAGLHGSGTPPAPTGIINTSNINTVTGVGAIGDYLDLVAGVEKLLEDNVPLDVASRFAIMSPRTWADFERTVTGITSDKSPLARPRSLENMQFLVTSNVSNGLDSPAVGSAIFLGDFSNLVMGIRREASVEILKADSYTGNLLLDIVGVLRVDFMVTRPSAFCVLTGVTS